MASDLPRSRVYERFDTLIPQMLQARRIVGYEKYGRVLDVDDGRDALLDALEEWCDLGQYLVKALVEREGPA